MQQPTLVFLHGLFGDRRDWQSITRQLTSPTRSLTLPYAKAKTIHPDEGFTWVNKWLGEQLADLTSYILVGYSLGGRIALSYASNKPVGLCGLFLESCHPGLTEPDAIANRLLQDQIWAKRMHKMVSADFFQTWYQQVVFSDLTQQQRDHLCWMRREMDLPGIEGFYLATSLARQPDLSDQLNVNQYPVAYVYGKNDQKFSQLACQLACVNDKLTTIACPNAGHNVHFCQPDWFCQQLTDWLECHTPVNRK